jgi:hypothetical protein
MHALFICVFSWPEYMERAIMDYATLAETVIKLNRVCRWWPLIQQLHVPTL